MSMEKTIKLFDSEFKKDSVKITPFEARKLLELELVYWDRDQSSPYKARVLVFKYPNHYYQYKESGITDMNMTINKCENVTHDAERYYQPENVKSIRETIEAVMKNTGKTDLKDIDLDMLSSCINATFNRKKLFYKWFDEYVNGSDCSEEERSTACEFLDWVFLHKIDGDKTGDLYFKE